MTKKKEDVPEIQDMKIIEAEGDNDTSNVMNETTLDSPLHAKNNITTEESNSIKNLNNNEKNKREDIKLLVEGLIKKKDSIRRKSEIIKEFVIEKNVEISHSPSVIQIQNPELNSNKEK
jgi:hypothetical protein